MQFYSIAFSLLVTVHATLALEYYGKYLGPLKGYHHGVGGDVYAVDARTLHIRDFTYDGEGPAAYFYVGNTKTVNGNGHRLADEKGSTNALPAYRKKHITLSFPEGRTLNNIKWFSVWCDEAAVSFADIKIPKNLDFPKPQKISPLAGIHSVSSEPIVVVDAQTLLIPSFSYDGEAPDAKFWAGRGDKPSPQGVRIPDENGKEVPLRKYDHKTIVLTLPGDLTVFDIGHFGVWCEAFTVDFGHIRVPRELNVPPSLKMLGVSPQKKSRSLQLSALQQSVQGSETYNEQDELQQSSDKNNFNYKNVLPLFNIQQIVRPTTYKPQFLQQPTFIHPQKELDPSYNRYKQKNGYLPLHNNQKERVPEDNVQIIPSIALVPEASSDIISHTQFGLLPPDQQFFLEQKTQEQLFSINKNEGQILQRQFPIEFAQQQQGRFASSSNKQESVFPPTQSVVTEQSAQIQPFHEPTGELIVPQFINNGFYSTDFPGSVPPQKIQQLQQLQPLQPLRQALPQPRLQINRTFLTDGSNKSFSRILLNSATGSHDSFVQYK